MAGILDILLAPGKGLIGGVKDIIDVFVTTDSEKQEARAKLLELERQWQKDQLEAEASFVTAQSAVLQAEIKSESWLARNWRPILMLSFTYIIIHNFVVGPLFSLTQLPIPSDMWELLKIGMGGYIIGRSAEKIAGSTVLQTMVTPKKDKDK